MNGKSSDIICGNNNQTIYIFECIFDKLDVISSITKIGGKNEDSFLLFTQNDDEYPSWNININQKIKDNYHKNKNNLENELSKNIHCINIIEDNKKYLINNIKKEGNEGKENDDIKLFDFRNFDDIKYNNNYVIERTEIEPKIEPKNKNSTFFSMFSSNQQKNDNNKDKFLEGYIFKVINNYNSFYYYKCKPNPNYNFDYNNPNSFELIKLIRVDKLEDLWNLLDRIANFFFPDTANFSELDNNNSNKKMIDKKIDEIYAMLNLDAKKEKGGKSKKSNIKAGKSKKTKNLKNHKKKTQKRKR